MVKSTCSSPKRPEISSHHPLLQLTVIVNSLMFAYPPYTLKRNREKPKWMFPWVLEPPEQVNQAQYVGCMNPDISESEAQIKQLRLELAAKHRWPRILSPLAGSETKPEEMLPEWNAWEDTAQCLLLQKWWSVRAASAKRKETLVCLSCLGESYEPRTVKEKPPFLGSPVVHFVTMWKKMSFPFTYM